MMHVVPAAEIAKTQALTTENLSQKVCIPVGLTGDLWEAQHKRSQ